MQPEGVNIEHFKLPLYDLTELIVLNIKDLQHRVAKIYGHYSNRSIIRPGATCNAFNRTVQSGLPNVKFDPARVIKTNKAWQG